MLYSCFASRVALRRFCHGLADIFLWWEIKLKFATPPTRLSSSPLPPRPVFYHHCDNYPTLIIQAICPQKCECSSKGATYYCRLPCVPCRIAPKALLDKLAIEREQSRLEAENRDLQTIVKQVGL